VKNAIRSFLAAALLTFSIGSHAGLADPVFVASDGPVNLRYIGFEAAYTNTLWLHTPFSSGPIFVNKTTPPGTNFALGIFSAGTPLIFSINVWNTGHTFYSGPAASNPDGVPHAWLDFLPGNLVNIGFEDLWRGGDRDYNDLRFSVANVTELPEPSTFALIGIALMLTSVWRIRARS
jgi:hypothetical protein